MTEREALIEVSKSCKRLAKEFGNKMYEEDIEALNVLKNTIEQNKEYKSFINLLKTNYPTVRDTIGGVLVSVSLHNNGIVVNLYFDKEHKDLLKKLLEE